MGHQKAPIRRVPFWWHHQKGTQKGAPSGASSTRRGDQKGPLLVALLGALLVEKPEGGPSGGCLQVSFGSTLVTSGHLGKAIALP